MRPNSILHVLAWMLILAAAVDVPVASAGGTGGTETRDTNLTESLGIHPERCPEVLEKLCPDGANTGVHCQEMSEICQRVYFSKEETAPAPRTAPTPEMPKPTAATAEDMDASSGEEEEEEESSDEVADPESEGDVSDGSFDDTSAQDDAEEATEDDAVVEEEAGSEEETEEYDSENVEDADVEEEAGNEVDADEYETDNEDADTDQGDE